MRDLWNGFRMSGKATAFAWECSPVTKSALLVHLALADVANDMHHHELWCSTDTISKKTRVGRSVVVEALDRLVELGLLTVVEVRPGRTTKYRFMYPDLPIQFSDDPSEIGLRKSEAAVRKSEGSPPETGPELKDLEAEPSSREPFSIDINDFEYLAHPPNPDRLAEVRSRFPKRGA